MLSVWASVGECGCEVVSFYFVIYLPTPNHRIRKVKYICQQLHSHDDTYMCWTWSRDICFTWFICEWIIIFIHIIYALYVFLKCLSVILDDSHFACNHITLPHSHNHITSFHFSDGASPWFLAIWFISYSHSHSTAGGCGLGCPCPHTNGCIPQWTVHDAAVQFRGVVMIWLKWFDGLYSDCGFGAVHVIVCVCFDDGN